MLNVKKLEEKIKNYTIELILNSDPETDWNNSFYKDKISISCHKDDKNFKVKFLDKYNWIDHEFNIYPFDFKFSNLFNEKRRKTNRKLKTKYKQIWYYIDNKTEIRKLSKIVEDFPIRIQRKEKLKKLNSQS